MDIFNTISITTVIGFILSFFNVENKKYNENKEKYFTEFLVPFYKEYKINEDINYNLFISLFHDYNKVFIPQYIHILVSTGKYDKLKKVLLNDYVDLFPNKFNVFFTAWSNLGTAFNYIFLLFIMILMAFLPFVLITAINETYFSKNLIVVGLYYLMFFLFLRESFSNDMYTFNSKRIDRMIDKKVKEFDKRKLISSK